MEKEEEKFQFACSFYVCSIKFLNPIYKPCKFKAPFTPKYQGIKSNQTCVLNMNFWPCLNFTCHIEFCPPKLIALSHG